MAGLALVTELAKVRAQLAAAVEDKKRLDRINSGAWQSAFRVIASRCEDYDDVRAAIDAFYAKTVKEQKP
jgi:hypothetical protein